MRWTTNSEDFVTPLHLNYSMVRNILLLSLSQYLCIFSTHIMSECPFEGMFFLELPFWVRHIPFWGVGGGGGVFEVLKIFYRPRVIFKILGPPCPCVQKSQSACRNLSPRVRGSSHTIDIQRDLYNIYKNHLYRGMSTRDYAWLSTCRLSQKCRRSCQVQNYICTRYKDFHYCKKDL